MITQYTPFFDNDLLNYKEISTHYVEHAREQLPEKLSSLIRNWFLFVWRRSENKMLIFLNLYILELSTVVKIIIRDILNSISLFFI